MLFHKGRSEEDWGPRRQTGLGGDGQVILVMMVMKMIYYTCIFTNIFYTCIFTNIHVYIHKCTFKYTGMWRPSSATWTPTWGNDKSRNGWKRSSRGSTPMNPLRRKMKSCRYDKMKNVLFDFLKVFNVVFNVLSGKFQILVIGLGQCCLCIRGAFGPSQTRLLFCILVQLSNLCQWFCRRYKTISC